MTTTEQRLPEFDFMTFNEVDERYALYREWREAGRVIRGGPGLWIVPRHADVAPLLRDRRLAHEMPRVAIEVGSGPGAVSDFRERILINRDGADHTRLRTLMGKAFSAPLVRQMRDHIVDIAGELLEPLLDGEVFDLVDQFAYPLPSQVICELLGIDHVDRGTVRVQAGTFGQGDQDAADAAMMWLREYLGAVLADRKPDPDGDLLQRMLAAEEGDDALTHDEIVDNAVLLFVAGFETTKHLISSGCNALLEFPEQMNRLWVDGTLSKTAVEEFLRYDGPAPFVLALTTEPVEIGDRVIKPGRVLALMLQAANHDGDVFDDPERLDIGRTPNRHVAFGGGVHHCLGAMLARVEADAVFSVLADRVASLERAGEAERQVPRMLGTFAHLPVIARPR